MAGKPTPEPVFFATPAGFRAWLKKHHATSTELLVGFYRVDSEHPSITWPESVDEALCFGWIDGVRKRRDETSYTIRFTPRRRNSVWSAVNLRRVEVLTAEGRMQAAGLAAHAALNGDKSRIYAYEQRSAELGEAYAKMFRKNRKAWAFFEAQPPSYRKLACWWIESAKKEETRLKRLEKLIAFSAEGKRV
ncbi:YdeI/OmpD-associated family protein [Arenimonas sp.]|uniref:YdeI/OmpD-associated family protein n=1 Tax=Arenimonas sp. TaxID=1872635 RepID=UPI0039E22C4E